MARPVAAATPTATGWGMSATRSAARVEQAEKGLEDDGGEVGPVGRLSGAAVMRTTTSSPSISSRCDAGGRAAASSTCLSSSRWIRAA